MLHDFNCFVFQKKKKKQLQVNFILDISLSNMFYKSSRIKIPSFLFFVATFHAR